MITRNAPASKSNSRPSAKIVQFSEISNKFSTFYDIFSVLVPIGFHRLGPSSLCYT